MTFVLALLVIVVIVLVFLVAGLLRSHAAILRKLHDLGAGLGEAGLETHDPTTATVSTPPAQDLGLPQPPVVTEGRHAYDIEGNGPSGEAHAVRVVGSPQDTVVAFLSSGCKTCHVFWEELRDAALPRGTRLVVVTKGEDAESPVAVADLAPAGVTVVMSSQAWTDYQVPGSPYAVHVDGPTGRVRGEGTGPTWQQVQRMLTLGAGDLDAQRSTKAAADAAREREADDVLLAAGITPGDTRLYVNAEQATTEPHE